MVSCSYTYVVLVSCFASLGGFLTAYGIGSSNGLQSFEGFLEYFDLGNSTANSSCTDTSSLTEHNRFILGAIISFLNLGGAVGNLVSGKPADWFGRKLTLVLAGIVVAMGTALQGCAVEGASWMLIVGRLVAGLGYGLVYGVVPVYVAELSPREIRGCLTSLIGVTFALGLIISQATNNLLFDKTYGWRISRFIGCFFSCVYAIGMMFAPNSPRWLMLKGKETEARAILSKTLPRKNKVIDEEITSIKQTVGPCENPSCIEELKLFVKCSFLKRLILGLILHSFAAACGAVVFFYSETLFCSLGIVPFITAYVIGGLTLLGNTLASLTVEKVGRKPVLVGGGVLLFILSGTAASLVYAFELEETDNPIVGYIVVCLLSLFMFIYSASWLSIPYVVTSEMFSLKGRAAANSIASSTNFGMLYVFTQIFPEVLGRLKAFGALYLLSVIDLMAAVFFLLLLPETKSISLEEVDDLFNKPWLEKIAPKCCLKPARRIEAINPTCVESLSYKETTV